MKEFLIYILQVNAALLAFYALYKPISARDTHLKARRFFLLAVITIAFSYPAISLSGWLAERTTVVYIDYAELFNPEAPVESPEIATITVDEPAPFPVEKAVTALWSGVALVLFLRTLLQLLSVFQLVIKGTKITLHGVKLFVLTPKTSPFSFLGWIFINPDNYNDRELQEIITHEKTHINQYHSLDILAGEALCILFWFNPAAWLIRHEIRQNLEFLADNEVIRSGFDRKNYQYDLLRLSLQPAAAQIINNFNVSQLKKRITMMNNKKTSRIGLLRYALLIPVTGLLILTGTSATIAQQAKVVTTTVTKDADANIQARTLDKEGVSIVTAESVETNSQPPSVTTVTTGMTETGDTIYAYSTTKKTNVANEKGEYVITTGSPKAVTVNTNDSVYLVTVTSNKKAPVKVTTKTNTTGDTIYSSSIGYRSTVQKKSATGDTIRMILGQEKASAINVIVTY